MTSANSAQKALAIAELAGCPEHTLRILRLAILYRSQGMSEQEAEQELIDVGIRDPGNRSRSDIDELKETYAWQALWGERRRAKTTPKP